MDEKFTLKKLDGSDKNTNCLKCKRQRINSMKLCKRCSELERGHLVVNSGNKNIDNFIKKSQSSQNTRTYSPFLEWVPYNKFTNIEYIGRGGFSQVYKAIWKKNEGISYEGIFEWLETEVVLKVLNNSRNVDKEFLKEKIIYRDLHSGNILVNKFYNSLFDRPWNDRRIIPYMAPELFKGQPYSYASDIYSFGMIMWELTSGHRPFHDQEHDPKLILDILDGKRPEITEDTPECWAILMQRCWHPNPSQRPTIQEISKLSNIFYDTRYYDVDYNKNFCPYVYDIRLKFNEAEKKRLEMVESKKPFVKNPGYEHPNSRYYNISLNSMLESINSTVSDLFSNDNNDNLLSNNNFDIMNIK
ncbi:hypothetical protein Glove_346g101 [Diversispora epigaea]|uniref:Protein kinase domain-containing protein n=1 Tax=Diversispora epigaea TaxID=1348612 RepID=A0A397HFF1_9GLOM|nr:hypothetical protein Glove_346g101 [Diversispora epigaea]